MKAGEERGEGIAVAVLTLPACVQKLLPFFTRGISWGHACHQRIKQPWCVDHSHTGIYDRTTDCVEQQQREASHEQGDKLHIKLALALLISALQEKCMPGISEGFNYTDIISSHFRRDMHWAERKVHGEGEGRTTGYRNYWNIVWQRNLAAQKWKYLSASKRIIKQERALTEQTTLISATVFLTLLPSCPPAMLFNDSLPTRSGISPVWSHYPSLLIQW